METESIIQEITQRVNIWEGVRQEINRFGKRLIEGLLRKELLSYLGRKAYERLPHSKNSLNGYYRRNLGDKLISLQGIRVPRLRKGGYRFRTIQRYRRRSRGFDRMIMEGYFLGLSTRHVSCFFHRQLKDSISPGVVSRVLKGLDEEHRQWQHRPLRNYPYLVVDGLWVKVKVGGRKQKRVVLFALGMGEDFKGEILAFRIAEGETEDNWTEFLASLYQRGVKSPLLVIHDGSQAIERGREFVYPHSRSQRCCFHKIANIQLHLQDRSHRREMLREAAHIYRAHSEGEAYRPVAEFYHRWHASEPRAVANFLQDIEKSLSYFHIPLKQPHHRSKLKTVNKLESFFRELRRRTNNIGTFENIKSLERHLFALIMINKTKKDTPYMLFTQNY
ncbi:MAG: IS256 family transposase [Acidobacteriota bacterium]